jgi:hypothetical protein
MVVVEFPAPGAAIVLGLKLIFTPLGDPEDESEMALLKPPKIEVVVVDEPWALCETVSEFGDADTAKFGETLSFSRRIQALLLASFALTKTSSDGK